MLKYQVIVDDFINKIDDGTYAANAQLPTIPELCNIYGVSKITIKKVMDELERVGMVTRRRGAGTFVKNARSGAARHLNWGGPSGIRGSKYEYEREGHKVVYNPISLTIEEPSELIAEALDMTDGFVYKIVRTLFLDGKPLSIEYTYMPIDLIPGVTKEVISGSIYTYIGETLGLSIDSAHTTFRAALPDENECEWLGIPHDYPLLEAEQTAFLCDGSAFEYSLVRSTKNSHDVRVVRHYSRNS